MRKKQLFSIEKSVRETTEAQEENRVPIQIAVLKY